LSSTEVHTNHPSVMKVINAQEKEIESRGTHLLVLVVVVLLLFSFFAYQLIYTPFLTPFYTFCFPMTYIQSLHQYETQDKTFNMYVLTTISELSRIIVQIQLAHARTPPRISCTCMLRTSNSNTGIFQKQQINRASWLAS